MLIQACINAIQIFDWEPVCCLQETVLIHKDLAENGEINDLIVELRSHGSYNWNLYLNLTFYVSIYSSFLSPLSSSYLLNIVKMRKCTVMWNPESD